jgi:hypothetical protein
MRSAIACVAMRCYVYQPFIETGGIDIKVYTLGAHRRAFAEARVAPTAARVLWCAIL